MNIKAEKLVELPDPELINGLIVQSLNEDIGEGDVTTDAIVGHDIRTTGEWIAREPGVIAGLDIAKCVFQKLDPEFQWNPLVNEGDWAGKTLPIAEFRGKSRAVLTAERTALNFVQRLSGIATMTRLYVEQIKDLPVKILDTRKTVPGLRALDKYAVRSGGGENHRMGLYDLAMVKDNHIVAAGSISQAIQRVRSYSPGIKVEVETTSLIQVEQALKAGADIIMLDNMSVELMSDAVQLVDKAVKTEASGNISIENVRKVAMTGVDYISVGALTHSVKAFDISQQIKI